MSRSHGDNKRTSSAEGGGDDKEHFHVATLSFIREHAKSQSATQPS